MAITQGMTTSFKQELLQGKHDFSAAGGHTFKVALFTSSASLDVTTTDYTTSSEVVGAGYSAGGATMTNSGVTTSGTTALGDFADVSWSGATFTARGAIIYNTTTDGGSSTTETVAILDFGLDKVATAQTFTITIPIADVSNALIRIV